MPKTFTSSNHRINQTIWAITSLLNESTTSLPNMVNNGFCHPSFHASKMIEHVPGIPPFLKAIKHYYEHPRKIGKSGSIATTVFNRFEPNKMHSEKHSAL